MKLLLYGGTFDPPHNGHLNNLRAAAACVKPDRVIVMPAGVPPHKRASTTPAALRLEMCACFASLTREENTFVPQLEVSDWEIRRAEQGFRNYTVNTLEMLASQNAGAQLYLAVGSDMLLSFDEWRRWQDILKLARLAVVSRSEGDGEALRQKARQLDASGERILFAPVKALEMSSTALRARLAAGESCEAELPETVRRVILREGLYGVQKPKEA